MIETRISFIEQLDNGVIVVSTKSEVLVEPEDLDENLLVYKSLLKGEKGLFLVILDPKGLSTDATKRKYVSKKRGSFKIAEAILLDALDHRIDINYYIKIHQPEHPVKVFNDKKTAIEWLTTFITND